jgi:uncharacterized OB-fold protein
MVYLKPLPTITKYNEPFWAGLKEHEFRIPKCNSCGDYSWIPYPSCKTCFSSDVEWTKVSGNATVWTYSVIHRGVGAFVKEQPYVVVVAKLVEEPRSCLVMGYLLNANPDDVKIGMPVKVVYEDIPDEDSTMYRFEPVAS